MSETRCEVRYEKDGKSARCIRPQRSFDHAVHVWQRRQKDGAVVTIRWRTDAERVSGVSGAWGWR